MPESIVEITGQVIDNANDNGLPGAPVEVWDATSAFAQPFATTKTDDNGRFTLRVDPRQFKLKELPELYFKVLDDSGSELANTLDLISWNASLEQDVTIYIVQPDDSDLTDPYTATELIGMTDLVGRSDFKGVFSEAMGVGTSSLSFVNDMFVNTFANLRQARPLSVATKRSDIVGQDTKIVVANLREQWVGVNDVLPFTPGFSRSCLSILTSQPLSLSAGQHVNLYQQDGVVKFYSLAPGSAAQGCARTPADSKGQAGNAGTPGAAGNDDQMAKLKEQFTALQKEHEELKELIKQKLG